MLFKWMLGVASVFLFFGMFDNEDRDNRRNYTYAFMVCIACLTVLILNE